MVAESLWRTLLSSPMTQTTSTGHRCEVNNKVMCALVLLGIAYSGWLHYQGTIMGTATADGVVAVLFGLYICSHPAANLVNLFFFRRKGRGQDLSKWEAVSWLTLNILVLLVGWMVIFMGTTRLIGRVSEADTHAVVCP